MNYILPNGTLINPSDAGADARLSIEDLGAVANAGTTRLNEDTRFVTALVAAAVTHTLIMEPMPVGAHILFQINLDTETSLLNIQEAAVSGGAGAVVRSRTSAGVASDFNAVTLKSAGVAQVLIDFNSFIAGQLAGVAAGITSTVLLELLKIRVNGATRDGWTMLQFNSIGSVT